MNSDSRISDAAVGDAAHSLDRAIPLDHFAVRSRLHLPRSLATPAGLCDV